MSNAGNMQWYSGDIGECIRKVKTEKTLLFVLSKDNTDALSGELLTTLNLHDATRHCENITCLQLDVGTTPYLQFSAIYEVPVIPCIHLILPSGTVLAVKTSDFSEDGLIDWLSEHVATFESLPIAPPEVKETTEAPQTAFSVSAAPHPNNPTPEAAAISVDLYPTSGGDTEKTGDAEMPEDTLPQPVNSHNAAAINDRLEYARLKLEEKKNAEAVQNFQKNHENEITRRNLGRELADFKTRQREQEIRDRLEEQRRDKAEEKVVRQRILAQIQEDRRDRFGPGTSAAAAVAVAPLIPLSVPSTTTINSSQFASARAANTNEIRLQIRLSDGAYMIGIFPLEARLGTDVREYISSRVFPSDGTSSSSASFPAVPLAPPLSDSVRGSFAEIVSRGYTFHQSLPGSLIRYNAEDESSKTLGDLNLWPSAVLRLHPGSSGGASRGRPGGGLSLLAYSQDFASRIFGVIGVGIRGVTDTIWYLGGTVVSLGQTAWASLPFGRGSGGRTVGGSGRGAPRQRPVDDAAVPESSGAYRRQGKIARLSHMPEDSDDEHATWNGNSTTQL